LNPRHLPELASTGFIVESNHGNPQVTDRPEID
jgi:hypothetical protein